MIQSLRRNRDFRRLWVSQTLSAFGSGGTNLAYPLLVLALTGSAVRAGAVGTISGIVSLASRLPAGGLADRYDRRRIMVACESVQLTMMALLAAVIAMHAVAFWMIALAAAVGGVVGPIFGTAEQASLRHLVDTEQLPTAISVNEARGYSADLAGPAAGGALFGAARWLPFGIDAISYAISAVAVILIRKPLQTGRTRGRQHFLQDIRDGVGIVVRDRFLRAVAIIAPPLNVAISCVMFVLIVVLRDAGARPAVIGGAETALALGGLAGAFLTPLLRRKLPDRTLIVTLFWTMTALVAAMAAFVGSYLVVLPLLFALLLAPASNSAVFGYQLATTPDHLQGRVVSVLTLFAGAAQPLAPLAGGVMVQQWGGRLTFVACSGILAISAITATLSSGIRAMRPLASHESHTPQEVA